MKREGKMRTPSDLDGFLFLLRVELQGAEGTEVSSAKERGEIGHY